MASKTQTAQRRTPPKAAPAASRSYTTAARERAEASSSNNVLNHLRAMIEAGELRSGERLPAERELAVKLKVSRPTLRAGLRSLVAMGVLESRHGSGTYVVDISGPPALDANPLRMMAVLRGFSPGEMLEARLALEMTAAGLAAERGRRARSTGGSPLNEQWSGTPLPAADKCPVTRDLRLAQPRCSA